MLKMKKGIEKRKKIIVIYNHKRKEKKTKANKTK